MSIWQRASLALLICVVASATSAPAGEELLDRYDELLARYADGNDLRYAAWRADGEDAEALDLIVEELVDTDTATLTPGERYSLYINLYNAKIVQLVLKGDPPRSIRQLGKGVNPFEIFSRKQLDFDGEHISLNQLEKRLREESRDPRIHFAVNCASKSCPPLAPLAYRAERLDEQLDRQTRAFLTREGSLILEQKRNGSKPTLHVTLSKIFDWYAKDFEIAGGALAFVERYAPAEVAVSLRANRGSTKLAYAEYDWNLNAAP